MARKTRSPASRSAAAAASSASAATGPRKTAQARAAKPAPERFEAPISRDFLPAFDAVAADEAQLRSLSKSDREEWMASKLADVSHFRVGLDSLKLHARTARELAPKVRQLPRQVRGRLLNPDGSAATHVSVVPTMPGDGGSVLARAALTDDLGVFTLPLPEPGDAQRRVLLAQGLGLRVTGAGSVAVDLVAALPPRGRQALGELVLRSALRPLPRSIISALVDLVEDLPAVTGTPGLRDGTQEPVRIQIGQDACNIRFEEDAHLRRFPYRLLVRLIEPRTTAVSRVMVFPPLRVPTTGQPAKALMTTMFNPSWPGIFDRTTTRFVERVPVDKPISVDGFRDQLIGLGGNQIGPQRTVPMAGTLGLGYVLNLAQVWKYDGLTLGNLLYSLPLAPGEQQRIAVSERRATASVRDQEQLSIFEQQQAQLREDASTSAVFHSAFSEEMESTARQGGSASSPAGGFLGLVGGVAGLVIGGPAGAMAGAAIGSSVGASIGGIGSSGTSTSSLSGARSYTSQASEELHRAVERQASARRSASRTAIRLATASESESVTTKVITNHNRMHALTIQYWEVLRKFVSTTEVEGCTLVCFVPLDPVRFLPPGQPLALTTTATVDTRAELAVRYALLHRHADAIRAWLPARHREGLRLLDEFMADPRAQVNVDAPLAPALNFRMRGHWLPFERLQVQVLMRDGRRLRPVQLASSQGALEQRKFGTREDLLAELSRRRDEVDVVMAGKLFLPRGAEPADIAGFELTRRFDPLNYQFDLDLVPLLAVARLLGRNVDIDGLEASVRMSPAELEDALHGPQVSDFSATLDGLSTRIEADSIATPQEFPPSGLAIPARDVPAVLAFEDLMRIERTLQHVVRNTLRYSKAVWMSLSAEERIVMLEGYTLGLPQGGLDPDQLSDPGEHVPLLNCVANEVLGYYGNCMVMPFSIPASLAVQLNRDPGDEGEGEDREPLTTAMVQDALAEFHREGFAPPESRFTLPTRGVIGEAVLGHCAAAEKIDLTRFWNWQDSPAPEATAISGVSLRGGGVGELGAPNALASIPQIVNNVGEGTAMGALAQALAARGGDATPFSADFVTKNIDAAGSARSGALAALTDLSKQAMSTGVDLFKAKTADDKEKKAGSIDTALKDLKDNAASYLAGAGHAASSGGSDAAAGVYAAARILSLTGGVDLPKDKAETLRAAYDKSEGGSRTAASTAWLTALKLIP